MALEFYPRETLPYHGAGPVIQNNPGAETIIITHAYEYFDNTRVSACNSFDAQYYGLGGRTRWRRDVDESWCANTRTSASF